MKYARWIRTLAVLGFAICLVLAASNAFFVFTAPGWPSLDLTAGATTYFTFASTVQGKAVGLLALLFDTAANGLLWAGLWRLGWKLDGRILDAAVATAFRHLALAFGGFVLLRGLALATLFAAYVAFGGRAHYGLTIGDTGLLLGGLAGLIAGCVARLLAQAAEVAAENAGFV